jgi:hypothetical protein
VPIEVPWPDLLLNQLAHYLAEVRQVTGPTQTTLPDRGGITFVDFGRRVSAEHKAPLGSHRLADQSGSWDQADAASVSKRCRHDPCHRGSASRPGSGAAPRPCQPVHNRTVPSKGHVAAGSACLCRSCDANPPPKDNLMSRDNPSVLPSSCPMEARSSHVRRDLRPYSSDFQPAGFVA